MIHQKSKPNNPYGGGTFFVGSVYFSPDFGLMGNMNLYRSQVYPRMHLNNYVYSKLIL